MPRFRGIRMITGAVSKAVRRQKEKRLTSVSKIFFKDGATKFGRARIDRALGSIYGHVIPQKNIGLTKVGKKYLKKHKSKLSLVKSARRTERIKSSGWMTYKKGDIIPF